MAKLSRGLVQARSALDDLRELAHGIHPAVLSLAGLAAALRSLAERATVPLEPGGVTAERCDVGTYPSVVTLASVRLRRQCGFVAR